MSKAYEKSIVNHLYNTLLFIAVDSGIFYLLKKAGFSIPSLNLSNWKFEDFAKLTSAGTTANYVIDYLKKEKIIPGEIWK